MRARGLDIAIVQGLVHDYRTSHPATAALVIEIAINSASLDREKASLYAAAGVNEYWIILATERRVEIYRRPEGGAYTDFTVVGDDIVLECGGLPGVSIRVGELLG